MLKSVFKNCINFYGKTIKNNLILKLPKHFSTNKKFLNDTNEVTGFITPSILQLEDKEIYKRVMQELEKVVGEITKQDGYLPEKIPEFIIADRTLKFKVYF